MPVSTNAAIEEAKRLEGEIKRLLRPGVTVKCRHHRCDGGDIIFNLQLDRERGSLTYDYLLNQRRGDGYERWLREFSRQILRETDRADRERIEVS